MVLSNYQLNRNADLETECHNGMGLGMVVSLAETGTDINGVSAGLMDYNRIE